MTTLCSSTLGDLMGELFLACDTPEPPKEGFFKGLFGGGVRPLDREELCESRYFLLLSFNLTWLNFGWFFIWFLFSCDFKLENRRVKLAVVLLAIFLARLPIWRLWTTRPVALRPKCRKLVKHSTSVATSWVCWKTALSEWPTRPKTFQMPLINWWCAVVRGNGINCERSRRKEIGAVREWRLRRHVTASKRISIAHRHPSRTKVGWSWFSFFLSLSLSLSLPLSLSKPRQ